MGLRLGASVNMRGIQVGTVTDLWVEVDPKTLEFTMPVLLTLDYSRFRGVLDREARKDKETSDLSQAIEQGLRAKLAAESLVTGQQTVQLDFHPDTEVRLTETDLPYKQLPTIPSTFQKVESGLSDLVTGAGVVLAKVSDLLSDENRTKLGEALANIAAVLQALKEDVPRYRRLGDTAEQTLVSYKALAERADGMLAANEDGVKRAISGLHEAESKISALAEQAAKLIEANQKGIGDFTNTGLYELTNLAVDAQAAVEQLRRVLEEMERDPARFFLGRPGEVEVQ
jgi:ABC-type transporter Mla subunit MlaD